MHLLEGAPIGGCWRFINMEYITEYAKCRVSLELPHNQLCAVVCNHFIMRDGGVSVISRVGMLVTETVRCNTITFHKLHYILCTLSLYSLYIHIYK